MIRSVSKNDARQIADIYNYYIENSTATFEESKIDASDMFNRIQKIIPELPWIVFEDEQQILGYAYATPWKERSAYRYSYEISVYVKNDTQGKGIGTKLYSDLISQLKKLGTHAIIGGITLPNDPSIKLHEKMGFKKVAEFQEVGFKFGQWLNVGYWQLIV
jgi:phosphinothricin acetyltransferase